MRLRVVIKIMSNVRPVAKLLSISTVASASTWTPVKLIFHEFGLSWQIMLFVGGLIVSITFMLSSEMQKTLRQWIRYRTEHHIAKALSYEIRRLVRKATTGRTWTQASAEEIRKAAKNWDRPTIGLAEIMKINRSGDKQESADAQPATTVQDISPAATEDQDSEVGPARTLRSVVPPSPLDQGE
jgi:hypothetical protein